MLKILKLLLMKLFIKRPKVKFAKKIRKSKRATERQRKIEAYGKVRYYTAELFGNWIYFVGRRNTNAK